MTISSFIKSNPLLKKVIYRMLTPRYQSRPRLWVKWFVNPFFHKKGRGAVIRNHTRIDVMPWSQFIIGKHTTIEDFCTVNNLVGDVIIGEYTRIGMANVIIGPIRIGNNVIFAQNIVLSGLNHGYEDITIPPTYQEIIKKEIIIEDDVWIGANSVVVAGVTIGRHAVIAAGSIVTHNVPPFTVVAGNPAKTIKQYNANTKKWEKLKK
ncbi:MAG: acyltransferase [Lentimicrobiaceae bacterium]|nr:acyltransferase [Lentimicrobiaceae bacterium]